MQHDIYGLYEYLFEYFVSFITHSSEDYFLYSLVGWP